MQNQLWEKLPRNSIEFKFKPVVGEVTEMVDSVEFRVIKQRGDVIGHDIDRHSDEVTFGNPVDNNDSTGGGLTAGGLPSSKTKQDLFCPDQNCLWLREMRR